MFDAFQLGPFLVWTHLIFLLIAVWVGAEFFFRLAQSAGLSLQPLREYALWCALAFFFVGRLVAVLSEYRVYLKGLLRILIFWDGQFSYLGGAIGIALVLFYAIRSSRTTFLQWLDVLLPAASFGLVFDWLGKFAAGQTYGRPTNVPWGVTYDAISVRFAVPIHPVQLYYASFYLALTFGLLVVRKHARRAGAETLVGIICAALATMFFESFRGDFSIPVFATQIDFLVLIALFISLGVFAAFELRMPQWTVLFYEATTTALCAAYLLVRTHLALEAYELRFNQLLALLALLATVVYVVVHRRRYPHL